jgi:CO/xanthine dehydrogenase FAD-binding subunit
MRACVSEYQLIAPRLLEEALRLLSEEPGIWLPIAGGTDVMVVYETGKLRQRKLLSIRGIPELQGIEIEHGAITLGALTTYTQIRQHPVLSAEFPLLCQAASWTGSIANQNRGTLGGNIMNASPAADSPPALIVYGAELELISSRGIRSIPYDEFHTGYKTMQAAPDELLYRIRLPRTSPLSRQYCRKVGTRKAQAISKVCLAAKADMEDGTIRSIRIALGSVAPTVLRCRKTEHVLNGAVINKAVIASAKEAIVTEIAPIDDTRSTAAYRQRVTANLLGEFLRSLHS